MEPRKPTSSQLSPQHPSCTNQSGARRSSASFPVPAIDIPSIQSLADTPVLQQKTAPSHPPPVLPSRVTKAKRPKSSLTISLLGGDNAIIEALANPPKLPPVTTPPQLPPQPLSPSNSTNTSTASLSLISPTFKRTNILPPAHFPPLATTSSGRPSIDLIDYMAPSTELEFRADFTMGSFSPVLSVAYSSDGSSIATSSNYIANMYTEDGKWVSSFSTRTEISNEDACSDESCFLRSICFAPNGKLLLTGGEDQEVKVWNISGQTIRTRMKGHESSVYTVDVCPKGRFIASGDGDGKVLCWDIESGHLLTTLRNRIAPGGEISSLTVHPCSHILCTGGIQNNITVWDIETSTVVRGFEAHTDGVYSVKMPSDGQSLVSGGGDKIVKVWDLRMAFERCQCAISFHGHQQIVIAAGCSPDCSVVLSGSRDMMARLWDIRNPGVSALVRGHNNSVLDVTHHPTAKRFLTASGDHRARSWTYCWQSERLEFLEVFIHNHRRYGLLSEVLLRALCIHVSHCFRSIAAMSPIFLFALRMLTAVAMLLHQHCVISFEWRWISGKVEQAGPGRKYPTFQNSRYIR